MLAWPALFTLIRLVRSERLLGRLLWHVLASIDAATHRGAAPRNRKERDGR
jgi:hypothetical protein